MKRVYTLFSLLFSFVLPLLASTETAIPVDRLYTLTPDEFKTLEIIDVDGNQVKDFRTQRTLDVRIDEFLGLYVRFNNRDFYYVARPIGGKPIKFISWRDNSVNGKRIMQLNGRTVSEYLRDERVPYPANSYPFLGEGSPSTRYIPLTAYSRVRSN